MHLTRNIIILYKWVYSLLVLETLLMSARTIRGDPTTDMSDYSRNPFRCQIYFSWNHAAFRRDGPSYFVSSPTALHLLIHVFYDGAHHHGAFRSSFVRSQDGHIRRERLRKSHRWAYQMLSSALRMGHDRRRGLDGMLGHPQGWWLGRPERQ